MEDLCDVPVEELLSRCVRAGDLEAWKEFVRRYQRIIARVTYRVSARFGEPTPPLIDDLVQETYLKLCADNFRLLRAFVHQHPDAFVGYIKVIAANLVRDHFKSQRAGRRSGHSLSVDSEVVEVRAREFDQGTPAFIERSVLLKEIECQLDACTEGPDRQRNSLIFWLYYRVGLTAAAIAALPEIGLGEKGVESTILRLTRAVRDRIKFVPPVEQGKTRREGILPAESL